MRNRFWELPLETLSPQEWEALCDRCGKCCLIKLEDEDTGEIVYTRLACKLFSSEKCACADYAHRREKVPDCLMLHPKSIAQSEYWLPKTCAYVLRKNGKPLPRWHYLLTGDLESIHDQGHSVRGKTVSEEVMSDIKDAENYIDWELGE